jgi:hypothetical protein
MLDCGAGTLSVYKSYSHTMPLARRLLGVAIQAGDAMRGNICWAVAMNANGGSVLPACTHPYSVQYRHTHKLSLSFSLSLSLSLALSLSLILPVAAREV